jgi:hypothetical protein
MTPQFVVISCVIALFLVAIIITIVSARVRRGLQTAFVKLKAKTLFTLFVTVCWVLLIWIVLSAVKIAPARTSLWPFVYAVLLMAIPVALLRVSRWRFFGEARPNEAINMLLAAVGVAVVLYWIMQGYLVAQLKLELSGETYLDKAQGRNLVIASLRIANIGNSNASIEKAILTISPADPGAICDKSEFNIRDLSLQPGDKDPTFVTIGLDSPFYTTVWGTEESRQVATHCPEASYYALDFELHVQQAFSNVRETWRASAIVARQSPEGRSPENGSSDARAPSVLDKMKKLVTGEAH